MVADHARMVTSGGGSASFARKLPRPAATRQAPASSSARHAWRAASSGSCSSPLSFRRADVVPQQAAWVGVRGATALCWMTFAPLSSRIHVSQVTFPSASERSWKILLPGRSATVPPYPPKPDLRPKPIRIPLYRATKSLLWSWPWKTPQILPTSLTASKRPVFTEKQQTLSPLVPLTSVVGSFQAVLTSTKGIWWNMTPGKTRPSCSISCCEVWRYHSTWSGYTQPQPVFPMQELSEESSSQTYATRWPLDPMMGNT
mmetsp:Transcript_81601/g.205323  ORF Transcript_81601/g.205323 Transcript_81601/m.205323 type:complete len:258 (+) Transcript_81601:149-922(+)